MTSVRLTDAQIDEIKKSGLSTSEFIRRAVDYYLLYLKDPYTHLLLDELEDWIKYKRVTNVSQCNTNVTQKNTDVIQTSTSVLNKSTDVLNINTDNTDVTQKNNQNKTITPSDNFKNILSKDLQMIQRILNNPLNSNTIPDYTLKMLSKKHALSKSSIEAWIVENKKWIKTTDFEGKRVDE